MRLLITGSGGFVGRHLQHQAQKRFPDSEILPSIPDIRDTQTVEKAIASAKPDHCVHLAAVSTIGAARKSPDHAWEVNLHGTLNVARAMLRHVPNSAFLFASTAESYGTTFQRWTALSEDAPLAPGNTYAATKAAADLALGAMAREGLRVIRMRPFNHTGPGQSPDFVVPAFASQIARIAKGLQKPEISVGNLDARRDFLDVRDVCDAYLDVLMANKSLAPGTIFNVCSGETRSIRSILDDLLTISGVNAEIVTDPDRLRPSDIPVARGDATLITSRLGWRRQIAWEDTLRDVYEDCMRKTTA
ncbi:GDP-mannose 4,6-dehydratase [Gluconobacter aidae]|uniref:NAD-dependent epimerase/dehydratase family protein n=1 Tax=Gluconobacter aidae TaxID=2662454 RepID=A0A7X1SP04_9PROT|nr:GDP-mannose 4,6-dehydratase [Gluconobacter aidae]MQR98522.1 NAD-dependent epimerase/dehydratase family protein [Gluconobacter aidae]